MGITTNIAWVSRQLPDGTLIPGATFNPWWGCMRVSEECKHCYAADIAHHYGHPHLWGPSATAQRRFFGESHWQEPLRWNRQAERAGHRRSVFCASMSDVFEDFPGLEENARNSGISSPPLPGSTGCCSPNDPKIFLPCPPGQHQNPGQILSGWGPASDYKRAQKNVYHTCWLSLPSCGS